MRIAVAPASGSQTTRIYRQTDIRGLTLIATTGAAGGESLDCFSPPTGAVVCYYAQSLDQNGNPSAMVPIGECLTFRGSAPLPTPMLLPVRSEGDLAAPRMRIRWVCPPHGLQRFRVYLSADNGRAVDGPVSALLVQRLGVEAGVNFHATPTAPVAQFGEYESATIRGAIGDGPEFSLSASIELDHEYFVFVRAVGFDGAVGAESRVGSFRWAPPANDGPDVPWPAWPLAAAVADPRFLALRLAGDEYLIGVQLGSYVLPGGDQSGPGMFLGKIDPAGLLFRTTQNEP